MTIKSSEILVVTNMVGIINKCDKRDFITLSTILHRRLNGSSNSNRCVLFVGNSTDCLAFFTNLYRYRHDKLKRVGFLTET